VYLYNNNLNNAIENAASNISYMPLIHTDIFANVVIEKLGKPVHKENCYRTFSFYFINYNIFYCICKLDTLHTSAFTSTYAEKETRYIQYWPLLLYLILRGRIYNSIAGGIIVQI
jgi:hypothetical protein